MNVQFFDCVTFFDIHYVHLDFADVYLLYPFVFEVIWDPKSWTLFVGAGVRFT